MQTSDASEDRGPESASGAVARPFEALFESAPDAVLIVDRDGKIVRLNQQAERMFGYARQELLGEPIERLVPERYKDRHVDERSHYIAQPRTRPMGSGLELYGRRKDGTELSVEISLSPVAAHPDHQIIAVVRDVTDRREAQRALAERAEQLEQQAELLDLADNAIIVARSPGREVLFWNHAAELLYGWSKDLAMGRRVDELLKTEFPEPFPDIQRKIESEGHWRGEVVHTCRDGRHVTVESRWSVRRDKTNSPVAYLELNTDITARKHAELELQQTATELARSNAELEQFTHVASHDLQEPLRMIASYTQLLSRRYRGRLDDDADVFIGYAVDGAVRMQGLIEDLLSYARVGSRGRPFEPVDCQALVEQTVANMRYSLDEAGASVTVRNLPTVQADSVQLAQLFQNLLSNALKYRSDSAPPRIQVSAQRGEAEWIFSVRDNGIGIDPQYAEQIFVMFKRLHNRERYEGTGIGLAICKKIVTRHGGRIWVEPDAGGGSDFQFTLPVTNGESV